MKSYWKSILEDLSNYEYLKKSPKSVKETIKKISMSSGLRGVDYADLKTFFENNSKVLYHKKEFTLKEFADEVDFFDAEGVIALIEINKKSNFNETMALDKKIEKKIHKNKFITQYTINPKLKKDEFNISMLCFYK